MLHVLHIRRQTLASFFSISTSYHFFLSTLTAQSALFFRACFKKQKNMTASRLIINSYAATAMCVHLCSNKKKSICGGDYFFNIQFTIFLYSIMVIKFECRCENKFNFLCLLSRPKSFI